MGPRTNVTESVFASSKGGPRSRCLSVVAGVVALLAVLVAFPVPLAGAQGTFAPGEVCLDQQVVDRLSVFHAFPGRSFDVSVNDSNVMTAGSSGDSAGVSTSALQSADIVVVDSDTAQTVLSYQGLILQDLTTVVIVPDDDNDVVLSILADAVSPVPNGTSRIQLRYMGVAADQADFTIGTITGISERGQSATVEIPAGTTTLNVSVDEQPVGGLGTVQAGEGEVTIYTVFNSTVSAVDVVRETVTVGSGPVADDAGNCVEVEFCGGKKVTVSLADGDVPTDGNDVILGTDGDDLVAAGAGDDLVCGGLGNDSIWGQDGDDVIWGHEGDDRLRGGSGEDTLYGGQGADSLGGGPGNDVVDGEDGNDIEVRGNTGDDLVRGGPGDDLLVAGNGGRDQVFGGDGNDVKVTGGPRPDVVDGGPGNDEVKGNKGADTLFGGPGDDTLLGGPQPDTLDGGEGIDACNGGITGGEPPAPEGDVAIGCDGLLVFIP